MFAIFTFVLVIFTPLYDIFTIMSRSSTQIRHQAILNRYRQLEQLARNNGIYQYIYVTSIYVQMADEMGYSEDYIAHLIPKLRKEHKLNEQ